MFLETTDVKKIMCTVDFNRHSETVNIFQLKRDITMVLDDQLARVRKPVCVLNIVST